MQCKECELICDGKKIASIQCSEDGVTIKCTEEGKTLCAESKGCC